MIGLARLGDLARERAEPYLARDFYERSLGISEECPCRNRRTPSTGVTSGSVWPGWGIWLGNWAGWSSPESCSNALWRSGEEVSQAEPENIRTAATSGSDWPGWRTWPES